MVFNLFFLIIVNWTHPLSCTAELKCVPLELRWKNKRIRMLYAIHADTVLMDRTKIVSYDTSRISPNKHSRTLQQFSCSKERFLNLFFACTIREWNLSPEEAVNASDTKAFLGYLKG